MILSYNLQPITNGNQEGTWRQNHAKTMEECCLLDLLLAAIHDCLPKVSLQA